MEMHYEPPEDQGNVLEKYTVNLTTKAKSRKLDPVIGRDEEIRRMIQILSRRTKNNPVLLGDPGVGKTAIAEGLAQRIISGDVPETLKNKEVLSLDIAALLAGAMYRGQFEDRLKRVLAEIEKGEGKYIIFIDELHSIVGAGEAQGSVDAGNMLKPALARGILHAVGATTVREYRLYIEKDPALERRFQPVYIQEPSKENAIAILRGIKEKYEAHHGIKISDDAIIAAVELSVRYITDRYLPDKAIDLIDETAASAKIEIDSLPTEIDQIKRKMMQLDVELAALKKEKGIEGRKDILEEERKNLQERFQMLEKRWKEEREIISALQNSRQKIENYKAELEKAQKEGDFTKAAEIQYGKIPEQEKEYELQEKEWQKIPEEERLLREQVKEQDIAQIVSRWTHIPVTRLLSTESQKLVHLEEELKQRVIGQDHALLKIANAIRRSRTGLSEEKKPMGSFLFLGPTGVGKTETAKALAYALFNDEKAMIRIDMGEYQEAHTVARLIGAPPGYVGHDEGGQLTEAVRRKPYSVILLDEVEKAHPQVFNTFLQILDDGILTDSRGRTVHFNNTIIILTSNLGSEAYRMKLSPLELEKQIFERVKQFFKPEFINRLDSMIIFNALDKKMMRKIIAMQFQDVQLRLQKQHISLNFSPALEEHILEVGFDDVFGARALKRIINELIVDEIALQILENKIKSGQTVGADYKKDKIIFKVE